MLYAITTFLALASSFGFVQGETRHNSLENALAQNVKTAFSELPQWDYADIASPGQLLQFAGENMADTFDKAQDVLPDGRPKLIHARGSLAGVTFKVTDSSKGTGLFATGGDACVARLSVAASPVSLGFIPGMALKCYRDNKPSGNIISMFSLDGQGSNWDFFANNFTNIVNEPKSIALKLISKVVFDRASSCSTWLSTKQWSDIDQEGNEAGTASRWPEQLYFVPAETHFDTSKTHGDFRDDLATIPVGTKLWDVYASDVKDGEDRYKLAEVTTISKFISSKFSDSELFFQHARGEEDGC